MLTAEEPTSPRLMHGHVVGVALDGGWLHRERHPMTSCRSRPFRSQRRPSPSVGAGVGALAAVVGQAILESREPLVPPLVGSWLTNSPPAGLSARSVTVVQGCGLPSGAV